MNATDVVRSGARVGSRPIDIGEVEVKILRFGSWLIVAGVEHDITRSCVDQEA
jgi:hypothetical protein